MFLNLQLTNTPLLFSSFCLLNVLNIFTAFPVKVIDFELSKLLQLSLNICNETICFVKILLN